VVVKPYDNSFKLLADEDPRAALELFAGIPRSENLVVTPIDRELNINSLQVDNLCLCNRNGEEFLVHLEAVSRYRPGVLETQVNYVRTIVLKFNRPCRSYLVLLTSEGVPDKFPEVIREVHGDYESSLRLRVVELWRIPAKRVMDLAQPILYPGWHRSTSHPRSLRRRAVESSKRACENSPAG
jgi:hypothetical protein